MKPRVVLTMLFLALPAVSLADVRQISERLFWIGDAEMAKYWSENTIILTQIRWMRPILWNDPVLGLKTLSFWERSYLVEDHILTPRDGEILLSPDDLESWASSDFYYAYAIRRNDPNRINFIPKSGDKYRVSCGYKQSRESLLGCTLRQSYPPDKHIDLIAEFTFFEIPEGIDPFKPIADSLLELAYCLDVTDEDVAVPVVERKPLGCELDITS